jgi:hypothetical protein
MAGAHPLTFWLSHLTWDYCLFLLATLVTCGAMYGTDRRVLFANNGALAAVFLVIAIYGFGAVLQASDYSMNST